MRQRDDGPRVRGELAQQQGAKKYGPARLVEAIQADALPDEALSEKDGLRVPPKAAVAADAPRLEMRRILDRRAVTRSSAAIRAGAGTEGPASALAAVIRSWLASERSAAVYRAASCATVIDASPSMASLATFDDERRTVRQRERPIPD